MANSIKENQYWLRLVVCASEHINPGLLGVLHNDGPNPDPTYIGIPRDPKLLYTFYQHHKNVKLSTNLRKTMYLSRLNSNCCFHQVVLRRILKNLTQL